MIQVMLLKSLLQVNSRPVQLPAYLLTHQKLLFYEWKASQSKDALLHPSSPPQVSERYESSNMLTALPSSFLEPLLSFTLMEDPDIRLLVLSILTSLIDRRHNASRLAGARSQPNTNNSEAESCENNSQRITDLSVSTV